jgi:hypothetical protein
MSAPEALFLALVFAGVLALLAGMLLTRLHWRRDIPPYGRQTRFLDVTLHPERYAKDAPFGVIRGLSAVGAILLAWAAVTVAREILRTMLRS